MGVVVVVVVIVVVIRIYITIHLLLVYTMRQRKETKDISKAHLRAHTHTHTRTGIQKERKESFTDQWSLVSCSNFRYLCSLFLNSMQRVGFIYSIYIYTYTHECLVKQIIQ